MAYRVLILGRLTLRQPKVTVGGTPLYDMKYQLTYEPKRAEVINNTFGTYHMTTLTNGYHLACL